MFTFFHVAISKNADVVVVLIEVNEPISTMKGLHTNKGLN